MRGVEEYQVKTFSYKISQSSDVKYSIGKVVNIISLCGDRWLVTRLIGVITLYGLQMSHHYVVHLKLI